MKGFKRRGIGLAAGLLALALAAPAAAQENLDSGKTGAQLYAADCAICHKSAQALKKSGGIFGLSSFLREHYTASRESAAAIASYLDSVAVRRRRKSLPAPPSARPRATRKPRPMRKRPSLNPATPNPKSRTKRTSPARPKPPSPRANPRANPRASPRANPKAKPSRPNRNRARRSRPRPRPRTRNRPLRPPPRPDKPEKSD